MTPRSALPVLCAWLAGCVATAPLKADLIAADELVQKSAAMHGDACAPESFAAAQAQVAFARIELDQGDAHGARVHTTAALEAATEAWTATEPCGGTDSDGDGLADIVDDCPRRAEDVDGDRDRDGCPDVDPYGDVDRDGIRNLEDECIDEPEDFDGHNDEDGCPETSEDADGDGVVDAMDDCPEQAEDPDGYRDADGCPDPDNDLDGIIDARDACPDRPEDLDGWDDDDGCPDDDNDGDGVSDLDDNCPNHTGAVDNKGCPRLDRDGDGVGDAEDACPDAPEVVNGYLDDDGCPDEANIRVKVTRTRLDVSEPITFVGDTAQLTPEAKALLRDVARALKDLPGRRVRVEGHTDAVGDETANMVLSRRRAVVVAAELEALGIDGRRLEPVGIGGAEPIDTNRTEEGRRNNRRIELRWIE